MRNMNLGMTEIIFIFLLALVIFGPRKLPEIGRQIGRFMGEFRRASNEFKSQIETEVQNLELEEQIKKDAELRTAESQRIREERAQAAAPVAPVEGTIPNEPAASSAPVTSPYENAGSEPPIPERPSETNA